MNVFQGHFPHENHCIRGLAPDVTEANLQSIIDKVRARSPLTRIMIAGMRLPPNLGADYTGEFEQVFSNLATKNGAVLVPFLLEGVGGDRGLNQPDQIHPTAAGQKIIAETVWKRLQPCCRPNELLGNALFQSFNVEMLEEPSQ